MKNIKEDIFIKMINLRNNINVSVKSTIHFDVARIKIDIENNIDRLIDSVRDDIGYAKYREKNNG